MVEAEKMQNVLLRGFVLSNKGLVRKNNEDNYLLGHCLNENQETDISSQFTGKCGCWTCAGVFDGMGGAEGGEIASYEAAHVFQKEFLEFDSYEKIAIEKKVEQAFRFANDAVITTRETKNTCGTTASIVVTDGNSMKAFHRGDSRIYLRRGEGLFLLSKDHTLAQMKLDVGIYHSANEIPEKEYHQLTEYLGIEKSSECEKPYESEWIDLEAGDTILICSDGLYDMCSNETILYSIIQGNSPEEIAKDLLNKVIAKGAIDNTTILIMEVE